MTDYEWLTKTPRPTQTKEEIEGRALSTMESVVLSIIFLTLLAAIAFLAGLMHQIKPDFFPAIWQVITTWGGIWPRAE